jgi:chromosome segregation and condensation protein ScpB
MGLEAILFTCDEPITLGKLKDIFPEATPDEIREALAGLKGDYDQTAGRFPWRKSPGATSC